MHGHDVEQHVARGLDGQTLITAGDRMADAIRLIGVEEERMTNVGDDASVRAAMLDENTSKRQHQRGRRCVLLGSAAIVLGPTIDDANARDRAVMRDVRRQ
jgi:hypothetical protein